MLRFARSGGPCYLSAIGGRNRRLVAGVLVSIDL
jgi:hypothetical protein